MFTQSRQIRNQVLLEWLKTNYPIGSYILNVKLGIPKSRHSPRSQYGRLRGVLFNSEAVSDAIVFSPKEILIIKLSLRPTSRTIERLLKCERAFKRTERFKDWWHLPITKILLVKDLNPLLINKAQKLGINLCII